jgi:hypothetical protein
MDQPGNQSRGVALSAIREPTGAIANSVSTPASVITTMFDGTF